MCTNVIIDADMIGRLNSGEMRILLKWIERGEGTIVYSDHTRYSNEIKGKASALFAEHRRNGSADLIKSERVENEESTIDGSMLKSNDSHIVALARASGTTVLCTGDNRLKSDFLNKRLLPPIGRKRRAVYPMSGSDKNRRDFLGRRKCPDRR